MSTVNLLAATQTPFMQRAFVLIQHNIPVAPLPPRTKAAKLDNWQALATNDPIKLQQLNPDPDGNTAAVARAEIGGYCFFELDAPDFREVVEQQTGQKFPDTFMVRSSPGKGHIYLRHTPKSIAFQKSLGKAYVSGKDHSGKEAYSFRLDAAYVVGPLSVKLDGAGQPITYTVINDRPIADCPDWLIDWVAASNKSESGPLTASVDGAKIPRGAHDTTLTRIAGKLRQDGLEEEAIYNALVEVCEKRCENYGADYRDMVRKIAKSVCRYRIQDAAPVILGGKNISQPQTLEQIEVPRLNKQPYPEFPNWVMKGTSLYEGFVKPVCERNSRIPYFMFLPAAALMMNYLGNKVRVKNRNHIPSFFLILIGEKGRAIKSSSVEDAVEYLHVARVMNHASSDTPVAGGKSLVWTVGSPEGLGLEMQRTNCKNAVLFYDELSGLTSKTEIDSSSLKSSLLSLYESSKFSNTVKSRKETYNIQPRSYCASLIACTTDETFEDQWSRLTGKSTGLDDRFMFVLQPETLPGLKPKIDVNTVAGSAETLKRINKAVQQAEYEIVDTTPLDEKIGELGNRTEIRAEKWALYFAIDLGRDSVDEECVDRGLAIAQYELAVKKYLGSPEAETKIAAAQIKYRRILERKFDGRAKVRDMERAMNSSRYGTEGWFRIYDGLKRAGIITEVNGAFKEVIVREPLDD